MNSFLPFLLQQQQQRPAPFLPAMPQYGGQTGQAGFGPNAAAPGGNPQSLGGMARDTFAMGREFGAPSWGSVGGSLLGGAVGLGPIGGVLGSWAQNAYNTTMGAREGNAARAGIGSHVPSQMALGALLDTMGPQFPGSLDVNGKVDVQGQLSNSELGWGLADREAHDAAMNGPGGGGIGTSGGQSPGDGGKGASTGGGSKGEGGGGWSDGGLYAKGGIVHKGFLPGNPPGPDNVLIGAQTGERVLTRAETKQYPSLLAAAGKPKKATKVR